MASIIERGNSYCVVYKYTDSDGKVRQKWETCKTEKEARLRKAEIEVDQNKGVFIAPTNETVSEFLEDFVKLYGEKKWGVSMYGSSCALIENYINPLIGNMKVQEITPRFVDRYIRQLKKTPSVAAKYRSIPEKISQIATSRKL